MITWDKIKIISQINLQTHKSIIWFCLLTQNTIFFYHLSLTHNCSSFTHHLNTFHYFILLLISFTFLKYLSPNSISPLKSPFFFLYYFLIFISSQWLNSLDSGLLKKMPSSPCFTNKTTSKIGTKLPKSYINNITFLSNHLDSTKTGYSHII